MVEECNPYAQSEYLLAVGMGIDEESGLEYLLARNSRGTEWGENGYVKIAMENEGCYIDFYSGQPIYDE